MYVGRAFQQGGGVADGERLVPTIPPCDVPLQHQPPSSSLHTPKQSSYSYDCVAKNVKTFLLFVRLFECIASLRKNVT